MQKLPSRRLSDPLISNEATYWEAKTNVASAYDGTCCTLQIWCSSVHPTRRTNPNKIDVQKTGSENVFNLPAPYQKYIRGRDLVT